MCSAGVSRTLQTAALDASVGRKPPTGVASGRGRSAPQPTYDCEHKVRFSRPKGTYKRRAELRADFGARHDRAGRLRPPRELEGQPDCRIDDHSAPVGPR